MLAYIFFTALFAVIAMLFPQRRPNRVAWVFAYLVIVVFVGLRHKVGMDWNNYLLIAEKVNRGDLWESFAYAEPAYAALMWFSVKGGMGVYGANLAGTAIFCYGLFRYARTTPLPWLALTVALPILVIVVAMSANRQAVAIGVLLWLVADWHKSSVMRRVSLILLAAMFHSSAVFFLAFVAWDVKIKPVYKLVLGIFLAFSMLWFLQSFGIADRYENSYVTGSEKNYSSGAQLHVLLNGLPAMLMLLAPRLRARLFPSPLSLQMAWFALLLIPAAFVFSAASGRMTLYLFPVSMYVFSRLPGVLVTVPERLISRTMLAGSFVVMTWFWMAFGNSSLAHIPYSNLLTTSANNVRF
jgi:hypothetical protein